MRGQIAKRQTFGQNSDIGCPSFETTNYLAQEPEDFLVGDGTLEDCKKCLVVYRSKELFDVTFEHPAGAGVVFGDLIGKRTKAVHRPVRALPYAARIRVCNKLLVEIGVQHSIHRMVQKPVTNRGFVDVARLGVSDFEVLVAAVAVSLTY